jgi:hypothetical protein
LVAVVFAARIAFSSSLMRKLTVMPTTTTARAWTL